jgi:hypothetical protein
MRSGLDYFIVPDSISQLSMNVTASAFLGSTLLPIDDELTARKNFLDLAGYLYTFISGPVGLHVKRFLAHEPFLVGIEKNDIGIGTRCQRAFLGGKAEYARRIGGH